MELTISDSAFDQTLTLRQSYLIMCRFLKQFNSRGAQETDLLAVWLEIQSDGLTHDPAQLHDFLACARSELASGS